MHQRIRVEVLDEPDVLQRVAVLNTALLKVLTGTRLIRLIRADYGAGMVELIVEDADIEPNPAPGLVRVAFLKPVER